MHDSLRQNVNHGGNYVEFAGSVLRRASSIMRCQGLNLRCTARGPDDGTITTRVYGPQQSQRNEFGNNSSLELTITITVFDHKTRVASRDTLKTDDKGGRTPGIQFSPAHRRADERFGISLTVSAHNILTKSNFARKVARVFSFEYCNYADCTSLYVGLLR